jgi:acetate kinase
MRILVLNSGSSSIKCQYFVNRKSVASAVIERIGEEESCAEVTGGETKLSRTLSIPDHREALKTLFTLLRETAILDSVDALDAVGHRVVHGGTAFDQPTRIDQEVVDTIRRLSPLAPLHNPPNLEGIEAIRALAPTLPQVAVFDTAFHQTMPAPSYLYPLPWNYYEEAGVRRYGFHGTSHAYVSKEAATMLGKDLEELNLITLHLGNGASVTAVEKGRSIDTSMGLTPLEGLMMGTRCGDIDPAIIAYLSRTFDLSVEAIDTILNKQSGLKGICGNNDMREVIEQAGNGDERSMLALQMYAYRIKKYIGAYTVALGKVDAIVFTGGIGEHAAKVREMACEGLSDSIGLKLDRHKNSQQHPGNATIHHPDSTIGVLVIQTDEELEIAMQTEAVVSG